MGWMGWMGGGGPISPIKPITPLNPITAFAPSEQPCYEVGAAYAAEASLQGGPLLGLIPEEILSLCQLLLRRAG